MILGLLIPRKTSKSEAKVTFQGGFGGFESTAATHRTLHLRLTPESIMASYFPHAFEDELVRILKVHEP